MPVARMMFIGEMWSSVLGIFLSMAAMMKGGVRPNAEDRARVLMRFQIALRYPASTAPNPSAGPAAKKFSAVY